MRVCPQVTMRPALFLLALISRLSANASPTPFELYGLQIAPSFSDPSACPWLRYNYVCPRTQLYEAWLRTWASVDSASTSTTGSTASTAGRRLRHLARLPRGTTLWLGMSHLYEIAAATMCQHRADLKSLQVLRCATAPPSCISKKRAYSQEARACTGAALTHPTCKLVDVSTETRCAPDAWPNVYGANGTIRTTDELPRLGSSAEDHTCGAGQALWPACSMSIVLFGFRGGLRCWDSISDGDLLASHLTPYPIPGHPPSGCSRAHPPASTSLPARTRPHGVGRAQPSSPVCPGRPRSHHRVAAVADG